MYHVELYKWIKESIAWTNRRLSIFIALSEQSCYHSTTPQQDSAYWLNISEEWRIYFAQSFLCHNLEKPIPYSSRHYLDASRSRSHINEEGSTATYERESVWVKDAAPVAAKFQQDVSNISIPLIHAALTTQGCQSMETSELLLWIRRCTIENELAAFMRSLVPKNESCRAMRFGLSHCLRLSMPFYQKALHFKRQLLSLVETNDIDEELLQIHRLMAEVLRFIGSQVYNSFVEYGNRLKSFKKIHSLPEDDKDVINYWRVKQMVGAAQVYVETTLPRIETLFDSWMQLHHEVKTLLADPETIGSHVLRIKKLQKDFVILELTHNLHTSHDKAWSLGDPIRSREWNNAMFTPVMKASHIRIQELREDVKLLQGAVLSNDSIVLKDNPALSLLLNSKMNFLEVFIFWMQRVFEFTSLKDEMHNWKANLHHDYVTKYDEFRTFYEEYLPFLVATDAQTPTIKWMVFLSRVNDMVLGYCDVIDKTEKIEELEVCPYPVQLLNLQKVFTLSLVAKAEDVAKFMNTDDVDHCFRIAQGIQGVMNTFPEETHLVLNIFKYCVKIRCNEIISYMTMTRATNKNLQAPKKSNHSPNNTLTALVEVKDIFCK
jgi:hypothetical protein